MQPRLSRRELTLGLCLSALSCSQRLPLERASSPQDGPPQSKARAPGIPLVVVMAIDGVRWQDIFFGVDKKRLSVPLHERQIFAHSRRPERPEKKSQVDPKLLPHLYQMTQRGAVLGAPGYGAFYASGPNFVSLPGYMEMLCGTRLTGCTENDCKTLKHASLLDDFALKTGDVRQAAAFSSWERIAVSATRAPEERIVSAGRYRGGRFDLLAEDADCARYLAWGKERSGGHGEFRHDALTAGLALSYLRAQLPQFLFLSLGETDEYAHQGDYASYLRALRYADSVVGRLRAQLSQARAAGRETLLMVTSDHGRSANFLDHGRSFPESARSFLFVEGSRVRARGALNTAHASLADLAPTVRAYSGLTQNPVLGAGRVLTELLTAKS